VPNRASERRAPTIPVPNRASERRGQPPAIRVRNTRRRSPRATVPATPAGKPRVHGLSIVCAGNG
jgi:hypothetical protein